MGIYGAYIPYLCIGNDTASQSPCNLARQYTSTFFGFDNDSRTLVVGTTLREVGCDKMTVLVRYVRNLAFAGKPIGMNIENRHKNRHLNTAFMEYFIFGYFFDGYDLAIGRCYNGTIVIGKGAVPLRATKKVDRKQIEENINE